jgi:hypothetical protein
VTKTKKELVDKFYWGKDPFQGFDYSSSDLDTNGLFSWNSDHPYLHDSIVKTEAKVIIEAGVWRGGSVIHMAKKLKEMGDGCVIAIDSWLGCHHLHFHQEWQQTLKRHHGRPGTWKIFYANVCEFGLKDYVLPIHMDTVSGLRLLSGKHRGGQRIEADIFHHDAVHFSPYVYQDLLEGWDLLKPGGHIIVDDYTHTGAPKYD